VASMRPFELRRGGHSFMLSLGLRLRHMILHILSLLIFRLLIFELLIFELLVFELLVFVLVFILISVRLRLFGLPLVLNSIHSSHATSCRARCHHRRSRPSFAFLLRFSGLLSLIRLPMSS
jgi:hypothetical protein